MFCSIISINTNNTYLCLKYQRFPTAVATYYARKHRVHARQGHYGRASNHSWVMLDSSDVSNPWFGHLMLLFSARPQDAERAPWQNFALVWYVQEKNMLRDHVLGARHFQYYGTQPEVVELAAILQPSLLLESPKQHQERPVFVALPYGVTHDSTRVGWTYDEGEGEDEGAAASEEEQEQDDED